jgi:hypothetical protein
MIEVKAEVANILEVFSQATPQEVAEGVAWYVVAKREAASLATTYGVALETSVGVIAGLSPQNKWARNLVDAKNFLAAHAQGKDLAHVKVCTYPIGKGKAIRILKEGLTDEKEITYVLSGPKMTEFFACIMGDEEECCIDGHAFSIWKGERVVLSKTPTIGVKLRREIKADYAKAGRILGLPASAVQAVTWVTFRRIHRIT